MKLSVLAAAFTLVTFGASDSFASTTLTKQQSDIFGGGGRATVSGISNHPGISASAGGFRLNDGTADLVAWCLDTLHFLNIPSVYEITETPFTDHLPVLDTTRIGNLQNLFDENYSDTLLADNTQSAGFQMALWEIIYEAAGTALNVSDGTWYATAATGVVNFANTILGNLGGTKIDHFKLTFYQQEGGQNLVSASVPIPAAGGMLALGLIGLYGASRRRRARLVPTMATRACAVGD